MLYVVYGNSVEYGTCRGHALFSTNEIPEEDKKVCGVNFSAYFTNRSISFTNMRKDLQFKHPPGLIHNRIILYIFVGNRRLKAKCP